MRNFKRMLAVRRACAIAPVPAMVIVFATLASDAAAAFTGTEASSCGRTSRVWITQTVVNNVIYYTSNQICGGHCLSDGSGACEHNVITSGNFDFWQQDTTTGVWTKSSNQVTLNPGVGKTLVRCDCVVRDAEGNVTGTFGSGCCQIGAITGGPYLKPTVFVGGLCIAPLCSATGGNCVPQATWWDPDQVEAVCD